MAWDTDSKRRKELPRDWHRHRARAKRQAGGRCQALLDDGTRCTQLGTDADHRTDRNTHDDLQWLCADHHKRKTQAEAAQARAAMRAKARHPVEPHPGLR